MQKVYVESLGCPKNLVDSELISYHFSKNYSIAPTYQKADIIIINTCGFIEPAKQEAINYILTYAHLKNKRIIVTGCLVNLYKKELQSDIPNIKEFYTQREFFTKFLNQKIDASLDYSRSFFLTPKSYTYVKISDGCNRGCSYCTIPMIKGKQYSRSIKNILREIKQKVESGFKEINFIAQDLINFGKEHNENLFQLIESMEKLDGNFRVRLLYLYPDKRLIDLVKLINPSKRIIPYMEIPIQHISSKILKFMKRPANKKFYHELFDSIRDINPKIIFRSTFIIGFPGEANQDFTELTQFLQEIKFHWAGFYAYSDEEKASSSHLPNKVIPSTIQKRMEIINELQKEITGNWLYKRVGQVYPVLIDEVSKQDKILFGRSECEAPEIDGNIIIPYQSHIKTGNRINVKITKSSDFDLYGELDE